MADDSHTGSTIVAAIQALKDLRISPQVSLTVALVSAVLLGISWLPDLLGVRSTLESWRPWFVIGAVAGILTFLVGAMLDVVARRQANARQRRKGVEYDRVAAEQAAAAREQAETEHTQRVRFLAAMTLTERGTCHQFIARSFRSLALPAHDADVLELLRRGVLLQISSEVVLDGEGQPCRHYTMVDWAWEYLHEHPEALRPE